MANKINHLLEAYLQLRLQSEDSVLATIVETMGSTYQKAGARMLISKAGELNGLLGGGCFERDLVEQAKSVFETGAAKTVFYDMRSPVDVVWGLGLGCNGAVRVLLQRLEAVQDFSPLNLIADVADSNVSGILVTVLESAHADFTVGSNQFLPTTLVDSQPMLASTPFPFATSAWQTVLEQKPRIEIHVVDGQEIKVFYDPIQPPWRLLVLGAGIDAIPLVQCAKALGWRVSVADHRPGYIQPERFQQADQLLQILPENIATWLALDQFHAVVLMTHNFEYDQRYLQAISQCRIPFIGLLGPAHRKGRLLSNLGSDAEQIADRVFGPVGLDIGAETPEEIALSIMAGIHAELQGRSGQVLKQTSAAKPDECIER